MAAQGERVSGAIGMDGGLLDPMAQDEIPEQEMLVVEEQEQFPPQMDLEPGMGAAAAEAAEYDTSPSLLQNPPILAESAQLSAPDIAQLIAMLAAMNANMNDKMDGNARQMNKKMDGMAQTMREEMQCMGAGLQDGLDKVKGGQDQLKGEIGKNMTAVEEFKIGQGEVLRATCWGRPVEVTEEVTVTQREIRHVEVTEYTETREMTKIGERLHGVGDAHTHTHR